MFLTNTAIQKAKPREKAYRLKDGDGLFLQIEPNKSKYWRLRYFFMGKEKMLALGTYPEISLLEAREKRLAARKLIANGEDPGSKKKEQKRLLAFNAGNTFRAVTKEWFETNKPKWTPEHAERLWRRVELHAFDDLGDRPIADITSLELLDVMRKVEKRGTTETSHRLLQTVGVIFRYAVLTSRAKYNPTIDLKGALMPHKAENYPTLLPKELPAFLKQLQAVETSPQNKLAMRLLMLTMTRQGELRQAEWTDIDFAAKEWRIRAETTKMRVMHIVPLSSQSVEVLHQLQDFTGSSKYLFPSQQRRRHPIMSENTINKIIETMGFKGKIVGHGFRALASSILNESSHFKPDAIERQLAHMERNKVRAAYMRAQFLEERVKMMQWWGDWVDAAASNNIRNKRVALVSVG